MQGKIHIKFAYSPSDNEAVKAATGARWSAAQGAWVCALTMNNCRALRSVFRERLHILAPLREWAWEQRKSEATMEDIRDLDIPADTLLHLQERTPELAKAIFGRPYQAAGTAFSITGRRVLLGDQPGLGKTYQALASIVESSARTILVVAPLTAKRSVWDAKIRELLPGYAVPYLTEGDRQKREKTIRQFFSGVQHSDVPAHILIINYEMLWVKKTKTGGMNAAYPELFNPYWDFIVMDESHHALSSTYNTMSNRITQTRLGAMRLRIQDNGYKLAMSGTPYRSRAKRAWGTLNWLEPNEFGSFWRWAGQHFDITQTQYAREVADNPKDEVAFRNSLRPYVLARTKAEVAPELPPIEHVDVLLDMDPAQKRAYTQMERLAEASLANGTRITANGILAELTRLRQFACSYAEIVQRDKPDRITMTPSLPSNKYEWITDFLRERDGFEGKVIIASQFTSLLKEFMKQLEHDGYNPIILTGETSEKERAVFQRRIQDPNDPAWIGLINTLAGGEAITLDRADDMIIIDPPWVDDVVQQLENRIHRISRIHNVTVYRLHSRGTIEERIVELTDQQRQDLLKVRPAGKKLISHILGH